MDKYKYQEQLRRMLLSEINWQAKNIFTQRTMHYANRYDIPCERIEMEHRYRYIGNCYSEKKLIKYSPWIVCCGNKKHIDYLVCHELAHFFYHDHSTSFWEMAERLFLGLDINAPTSSNTIKQVRNELVQNKELTIFTYWGRPSYLKSFFWNGHVKYKTPLIVPIHVESTDKQAEGGYYTTFEIHI